MISQELSVTIYGLESVLYQGKINALTSINDKGTFDILPFHTNFISVIKDRIILHKRSGDDQEFKLKKGVLKIVGNQVSVFLGIEGLQER